MRSTVRLRDGCASLNDSDSSIGPGLVIVADYRVGRIVMRPFAVHDRTVWFAENGVNAVEFTDRLREHATYTDHRRAEHDHRVRNENMQVLGQRLNVLTKLIENGQFDSIGVDSEKMDLLFAHFVEEVAALASVPVTELPPVGAFDQPNEVLDHTGDNT